MPKSLMASGKGSTVIVKVKLDDWAKKKLKSRMGLKMLAEGEGGMSPNDVIVWSLIQKADGDTIDLTEEGGKLGKLLDRHS